MTAREQLIREMTHNHLYMTDERAEELVDAFAHALAEQQRAFTKEAGMSLEDGQYVAVGDVIDEIDPQT